MWHEDRSKLKTVTLSQGVIEYREYGQENGTPIVFVHGLLVNGYLWRKVGPRLSSQLRCIVPDWPLGSHHQKLNPNVSLRPPDLARIIADFLAALELDSVVLVGNDTGGALCQLVVTTYPERIAGLVLTNCDAYDNFPPAVFHPLQWAARVPIITFLISQSMRLKFLRRLPMTFGALTHYPLSDEALDEYLYSPIHRKSIGEELCRILIGISPKYTLEAATRFPNFKRPVLLAWGRNDRFFPLAHAQRMSREFPNARLEMIDEAAAFVAEDQPERLAELIKEFANQFDTRAYVLL
jgi:pimeloyl-ACP methyl ester carboxylesterase